MSKISEFVNKALENAHENEPDEYFLGVIPNQQGQKIASETGIQSVSGAEKILTAHGVRHAFVRHQSKKTEAERGQVGIATSDFEFLADILSSPSSVERGDVQNRKNQDVIKFSKNIKGSLYCVIMSVSRSKKGIQLIFNTMFIKK